jgi:hypothetical protein
MNDYTKTTRKNRALTQKLYLVNNNENGNFAIMGSTGNVYNVSTNKLLTCTCPDYMTRKKRCKHIYFVLMRIFSVKNPDAETFNETELSLILKNNEMCVSDELKNKYLSILNTNFIPNLDDLCAICLDELDNGEKILSCLQVCKKSVHADCYLMWKKMNKTNDCVYCKSNFVTNKDDLVYIKLQ